MPSKFANIFLRKQQNSKEESTISIYKNETESKLTDTDKTVSLFQFIRELNKLKQKAILDIKDYPWAFALSKLPDDPDNIKLNYCDRVEEETPTEDNGRANVLLSVHKPEFQKCPEPDVLFKEWLLPGWNDYHNEPKVKEYIELPPKRDISNLIDDAEKNAEEEPQRELFKDNEERVKNYEKWIENRSKWAEKQKITEKTRNLFTDLYRFYFELERESETEEIVVTNGILSDKENPAIRHPVLTHRVKIDFDADSNIVSVIDTDVPSELYSVVFQVMDNINLVGIKELTETLQRDDYHPLDRNDTPGFLKRLVYQLSSDSYYSDKPLSADEKNDSRLLLYLDPCFIVRKRLDGTMKAIERIIEDVQDKGIVPKPIADIVSGGTIDIPEDTGEATIEERLASVGGESIDILLSKEANKEQLDIAKRIENYNAVLVQGPPGTGKTHTIANLMGHFLAQGKSVLVTSYTKKALSVLKEKVTPGLQDLCVSMLDDSNVDMERSVDGITSYTSQTTSFDVKRKMDSLALERQDIIKKLAEVRKKIYEVINKECNCIVLNGEDISPSKAAAFVVEYAEDLSYIPGKVRLNIPLPLSFDALNALYRSNGLLTADDETELNKDLPNPDSLMNPSEFETLWKKYDSMQSKLNGIRDVKDWKIYNNTNEETITISADFGKFTVNYPDSYVIDKLCRYASDLGRIDSWMKAVAIDGKYDNAYRQRWLQLIEQIEETCSSAEKYIELSLGNKLSISESMPLQDIKSAFEEMCPIFSEKGKIGKLTLLVHKNYGLALDSVSINEKKPESDSDCRIILSYITMLENRDTCGRYWDELMTSHGVPKFSELDNVSPERIAQNYINPINRYIDWYKNEFKELVEMLDECNIPGEIIFKRNITDNESVVTDKILSSIESVIPYICDICTCVIESDNCKKQIGLMKQILTSGERCNSRVCREIIFAIDKFDSDSYAKGYAELERVFKECELLENRRQSLGVLNSVAPEWAEAIRSRTGIHGQNFVPSDIDQAWKWKQLDGIIADITKKPFAELQENSRRLSREYRNVTAQYAEKSAWYHLLIRTESNINMKQDLEGWRLTVRSIGRGTGRRAPALRAKARELMAKCQNAVPCWIMPINKALESLDPRYNKFDIVIIDEASQSDISSLAILYMGEKLIIVGDDRQVSPMAVGVEDKKINSLQEQYIKDKIPNSHLYTAKTSIYDIARTTFQPLMLREHFRCVPEIIGFSNMLSYDGKIKPLRDASNSVLLPAVVNYRVTGGCRIDQSKTNPKEASAIVALMKACFEQPEYEGKTFGVISMLGDAQVKLIQQKIESSLEPKDIISRSILCGNSANFQGDERDVIFLSLVDSGTGNGPLNKMEFGADDSIRKRYNVATSRARDQLWVVDSLDSANDLKPGDIRKRLIDYSLDPKAVEIAHAEIESRADSPFEVSVATALSDRGYHIEQQWKVGSYRLDIVAVCGKKKVAIECDGERWHSGEEKIREDMERQTILERLGWRFIRIRGSEFYRNSEKTIERIIKELTEFGIETENVAEHSDTERGTDLLNRVKLKAAEILEETQDTIEPDIATIAAALNTTSPSVTKEQRMPSSEHAEDLQKTSSSHTSEQLTIPGMPQRPAAPASKAIGDGFITELLSNKVDYIDNRVQSGIVWVLYDKERHKFIEDIMAKHKYSFSLEKRPNATKGCPAWMVIIRKEDNNG